MKRLCLVLVILLLCGCVAPVMGIRETFQNWKNGSLILSAPLDPYISDAAVGDIFYNLNGKTLTPYRAIVADYCAVDISSDNQYNREEFLDSSQALMYTANDNCLGGRKEIQVVSGVAREYCDGVYQSITGSGAFNPSYCRLAGTGYKYKNYLWGETDHHIVGAIPTNWTIIKDLINPFSTGVYAQNPATSEYSIVKNSDAFYIDADTDSLDTITTENFYISDPDGIVINTTVVDSSVPHHQIKYYLTVFLTEANGKYGLFSAHFDNSSVYAYFSVTGSGAVVTLDAEDYTTYDTMDATYIITPAYWDTSTYTYTMDYISGTTGATLASRAISSSTGTTTYTLQSTDPVGAIYVALIATPNSGGNGVWMNFDYAEYHKYSTFDGYVLDAETGLPITGANVTFNQNDVAYILDSTPASGYYDTTGTAFASGTQTTVNVTASGYNQTYETFIPASETRIAKNITLVPTTITAYTGLGIGGVDRDGIFDGMNITSGYGRPIPSANAYLWNNTYSQNCTTTTNIAGWYSFSNSNSCNLIEGRLYTIQLQKLRYQNSTLYNVTAHGELV
jgi:hypothetical protein